MSSGRPRVVVAYKSLPRYRVRFFESLRGRLAEQGVDLQLVYGDGSPRDDHRNEGADVDWGVSRRNRVLRFGRRELIWQPCLGEARRADLVVVEQASRLLVNYVLIGLQAVGPTRVAYWGHGENLQRHTASASSEWLKRRVSRLPHWWFAYTEGSKRRVTALGYPPERVTVVQNAQDTERLAVEVAALTAGARDGFRDAHGLGRGPIGLFLGSLTREKRIDFLIDACSRIAAARPDFRLLVAGDGDERARVLAAAERYRWIRYVGRLNTVRERALALAVSDVLLVPGLVGLVALDGFAAAVPLLTTAVDFHSPEIEYVRDGDNGVIAPDPHDAQAYAAASLDLLGGGRRRDRLVRGCREAAGRFTLAAMVERFAGGVMEALAAR